MEWWVCVQESDRETNKKRHTHRKSKKVSQKKKESKSEREIESVNEYKPNFCENQVFILNLIFYIN